MKKFYWIALISLLILTMGLKHTEAQNRDYIPLLNQGAIWFETYTNYSWPPSPYGYNSCGRKYLGGDTIINNNMYSKIYHEKLDIYCTEIILSVPEYYGAIREDIPEQKVWYLPPDSPLEFLYFDFSISTGDTVFWWGSWFNQGGPLYLIVSDLDTITTIDGVERRRWLFDEDPYSDESSMIEGIGSSSGLLAPYEVIFEYWNYLISLNIDTTLIYCDNFNGCEIPTDTCTTVGVNPCYDNSDIIIYPNPVIAGNPVRISGIPTLQDESFTLELFDIIGIRLESHTLNNTDFIIQMPSKSGIYVATIVSNGQIKGKCKILVE
ncbi:MAG: T9SS type A sorting domain-containing protein [Bacteroidales bacterium]|nr:T9SS type A sorting domain-containing protein [Bacteroidales bacterium]